ncbi:thiamine diphosphokinase [Cucumibacter marinus]|uniref:thiamine diphosphokinase n=1 Tax=Cucumibacter marinus TaxID=1121252 RepID=UPI000688A61E|nr:thiamine diphosphokinase [Cucumibacter marinus]
MRADFPQGYPLTVLDRPAIVVGGAAFDKRLLDRLMARGYPVIAADGAADALLAQGVSPDFVVGDMDSIADLSVFEKRSRVIAIEEQVTTDFEKCLYAVAAPAYFGLGLTGRRFDHTLTALHVAVRVAHRAPLVIFDETDLMLAITGSVELNLERRQRVSIFPLSPIRFERSEGLTYPLDGLTLAQGVRVGTSNEGGPGRVRIEPAEGEVAPYLVILPIEDLGPVLALLDGAPAPAHIEA